MKGVKQTISPQARSVYRLLLEGKEMTAKEIAGKLGIFPNAVYRAADNLVELGCVKKLRTQHIRFVAKPIPEAVDLFLIAKRQWFLENFCRSSRKKEAGEGSDLINVSFVQSRSELVESVTEDQKSAVSELCLVISGDEVPAETVLENKRAIDRGVIIRIIAQRADEGNINILKNWQKMGIKVRYSPLVNLRIIVIDSKIVYITNYNPENKKESLGVRFEYQPIAKVVKELFSQKWKTAKKL